MSMRYAGDLVAEVNDALQELASPGLERVTSGAFGRPTTPTISVIIPTFNEAENLPHVLPAIPPEIDELIIVDGLSTDQTVEVALELRPDARIVMQDGRGKGNALACGFRAARGDIFVMMDADGSTDPEEIASFITALQAGADFVKGSRYLPGGGSADISRVRSMGNRALGWLVNVIYRIDYTDLCYGFNAFWSEYLDTVYRDCDGFEVETVMNVRAARAGLTVTEVPSYEHSRIHGTSNLNAVSDGMRVLRAIFEERSAPLPEVEPRAITRSEPLHPVAVHSHRFSPERLQPEYSEEAR
jgi:glycosyltransferase involved in cell wall biosynthesis